ncbi:nephrin, partial [Trichonephila clavata]
MLHFNQMVKTFSELKLDLCCQEFPYRKCSQLNLRLGSKLRHSNILEGNDVYFECNIRANPWYQKPLEVRRRELVTNISAGVIVSNQSLVLQKVHRSTEGGTVAQQPTAKDKRKQSCLSTST